MCNKRILHYERSIVKLVFCFICVDCELATDLNSNRLKNINLYKRSITKNVQNHEQTEKAMRNHKLEH